VQGQQNIKKKRDRPLLNEQTGTAVRQLHSSIHGWVAACLRNKNDDETAPRSRYQQTGSRPCDTTYTRVRFTHTSCNVRKVNKPWIRA